MAQDDRLQEFPVSRLFGALFALTALAFAAESRAAAIDPPHQICIAEARALETAYNMPSHLLGAISVVETGRWDKASKASFAWPWTVTAEGRGRYFPSKAAAISEVRRLQGRGISNIDVGCMQINLKYHPDAVTSLDEAFDPATNVAYGASFLKQLFGETGGWTTAAARYHSATPEYALRYRTKLLDQWSDLRRGKYASEPDLNTADAVLPLRTPLRSPNLSPPILRQASFRQTPTTMTREVRSSVEPLSSRRPDKSTEKAKEKASPAYIQDRAQARAFAQAWREEKLAEYRARKGGS